MTERIELRSAWHDAGRLIGAKSRQKLGTIGCEDEMIVFELICPEHHRFEGWFASADDFDSQKARGLLSCPVCSHSSVEKLLTAKIAKGGGEQAKPGTSDAKPAPAPGKGQPSMQEVIDYILTNTEDVGKNFAAEARKIHNKEAQHRSIRGVASVEETRELLDEGIEVVPLPIPPTSEWN
jgi:hypothetical protein